MANYLKRKFVCERLRLSNWQSYQIVGCAYGHLISSDEVVAVLSRARRGMTCEAVFPYDLLTPEELAVELSGSGITARDLLNWTRRKKKGAIPPHYRLNKCTIRFSRSQFMAWLDARSRIKSLKVRVA